MPAANDACRTGACRDAGGGPLARDGLSCREDHRICRRWRLRATLQPPGTSVNVRIPSAHVKHGEDAHFTQRDQRPKNYRSNEHRIRDKEFCETSKFLFLSFVAIPVYECVSSTLPIHRNHDDIMNQYFHNSRQYQHQSSHYRDKDQSIKQRAFWHVDKNSCRQKKQIRNTQYQRDDPRPKN